MQIYQKKKEHQHSLERLYFEKKIQALENAVAEWFSFTSSFTSFTALFEQMSGESELDPETFLQQGNLIHSEIENFLETSNNLSKTVCLYLDVDESFWDDDYMKNFYSILASINGLSRQMNINIEIYNKFKDTEHATKARKNVGEIHKQMQKGFKELSILTDKYRVDLIKLIQHARKVISKYEF